MPRIRTTLANGSNTYASLSADQSLAGKQTFSKSSPTTLTDTGQEFERFYTQSLAGGLAQGYWQRGIDVGNSTNPHRDFFLAYKETTRSFGDCVTTINQPTITSAAGATFAQADQGRAISGTGIPNGTTILSVQSPTAATMSANATASGTVIATITAAGGNDIVYAAHNGGLPASVGIGKTPPDATYRLQVVGPSAGNSDTTGIGSLLVQGGNGLASTAAAAGVNGSGFAAVIRDWGGVDRWWVEKTASGWAQRMRGDATTSNPVFVVQNAADDVEQFRVTANGKIEFAADTSAIIWRAAAGLIQVAGKLVAGNTLGVGSVFSGTPGTSPTQTADVANSGAAAVLAVRTTAPNSVSQLRLWASNSANRVIIGSANGSDVRFVTNSDFADTPTGQFLAGTTLKSVLLGSTAIATSSTDGFPYIPAAAGTPTGVPSAQSGFAPVYYDSTNHKLWIYDGGWKGVVVA